MNAKAKENNSAESDKLWTVIIIIIIIMGFIFTMLVSCLVRQD